MRPDETKLYAIWSDDATLLKNKKDCAAVGIKGARMKDGVQVYEIGDAIRSDPVTLSKRW